MRDAPKHPLPATLGLGQPQFKLTSSYRHCSANFAQSASARGSLPINMAGVMSRQKDIMYSSRTRYNTDKLKQIQRNKKTILDLIAKLPQKARNSAEIRDLAVANRTTHVDIVHLIYRQSRFELESKDYEFSRDTVREHWAAGKHDMQFTIEHPDLLAKTSVDDGVTVYDLANVKF